MLPEILISLLFLFPSVILHECAHGWVANKLGDPTAKNAGRLTLNPLSHVDPVGTIVLPGISLLLRLLGHPAFIFGWAKPVPVNFARLHSPRRDMVLVAMAGPLVNIAIAVVLSFIFQMIATRNLFLASALAIGVYINIFLAVFNMIPVPPLDGSRLVMGVLPASLLRMYASLEPFGIFIVMLLLYNGISERVLIPLVDYLARSLGINV